MIPKEPPLLVLTDDEDYLDASPNLPTKNSFYDKIHDILNQSDSFDLLNESLEYFQDHMNSVWSKRYKKFMEIFAVAHFIFVWLLMPIMCLWVPFYVLFCTKFWPLIILYFAWMVYDLKTPQEGGRQWEWYQNLPIWKHFCDYFPMRIVKTANLVPHKNYVIGSHPHGILSIGAFSNFLLGNYFKDLYPGITASVLTLSGQFLFPLRREIALWLGGVCASRKSLEYLLQTPGYGRAVVVVVGGAEESLDAYPGSTKLKLNDRYGFVRSAIKYQADLVPTYHFGENNLFGTEEGHHAIRAKLSEIKKRFGFAPPIISGRGVVSFSGILPHRHPVTTVIGEPISSYVEGHVYGEEPKMEDVKRLHGMYMNALHALFENHKRDYLPENEWESELKFV